MRAGGTGSAGPPGATTVVEGATTVVEVDSGRLLRRFIDLPFDLYRHDPHWVPPLRRDERRRFDPAHNPFLQHARMQLWLAERSGRTVGRVAAIHDRLHDQRFAERTAWFGFFEAADAATAAALLGRVEQWAREVGLDRVRGPANPSLNESAGLLVDGFGPPYVLMPYNPPSYAGFVEGAGYGRVKDLFAWDIDLTAPLSERVGRVAERVRDRHGIVIRPADMRRFREELQTLKHIYRTAWQDNWGFVPPTDAEIDQLAADLRPIADPELVLFAEMRGEPVGCAVSIPDLNQVLARMAGRLWPFGVVHFLRRRQIVRRARMLLLGVVPEARRLGLYPLLMLEAHRRGASRGYTRGEVGWTLEDNHLVNAGIAAAGGRPYRTYRLYEKPLG
jgi:GNAT superfamily N-acetyltransferase